MTDSYTEALRFIYRHIPSRLDKKVAGDFGLARAASLMSLLGNPQNDLKVIHIAGTSGKGSTAFYTSQLLVAHGFKVSLTVSPHLIDIRERCQINNRLATKKEFAETVRQIMPKALELARSKYGKPSYFDLMIALFFQFSKNNKVDYVVVETGLGGFFDSTNTVVREDKVCVVTRIGFDHMEILGNTLEKIASQKAGIIQDGNTLISLWQSNSVRRAFEKRVKEKKGRLIYVKKLLTEKLNSPAIYQKENASLALATVKYLGGRDRFKLNQEKISKILKSVQFPGRMDVFVKKGKTVIADGAHNKQKMANFVKSLKLVTGEKIPFLVAFKEGKNYKGMLDQIVRVASYIIVTEFVTQGMDLQIKSESGKEVLDYLKKKKFNKVTFIEDNKKATEELLRQRSKFVAITGSLYLLSAVYSIIKPRH